MWIDGLTTFELLLIAARQPHLLAQLLGQSLGLLVELRLFLTHLAEPLGRARQQLLRATAAVLALTPVMLALTPAGVALALGRVPGA